MKLLELKVPVNARALVLKLQQELIDLDRKVKLTVVADDGIISSYKLTVEGDAAQTDPYVAFEHVIEVYVGPAIQFDSHNTIFPIEGASLSKAEHGIYLFSTGMMGRKSNAVRASKLKLAPVGVSNLNSGSTTTLVSVARGVHSASVKKFMDLYANELV